MTDFAEGGSRQARVYSPFLTCLLTATLLSLLAAELPLLALLLWAPRGAGVTNGEVILIESAIAFVATCVVWIASRFYYRKRSSPRFGWRTLIAAWFFAAIIASVFALAVIMPSFSSDNKIWSAIARNYLADELMDRQDYARELASLGLPAAAFPENLGREDLAKTAANLAEASALVARHSAAAEDRAAAERAAARASRLTWGYKATLLMRIDRNASVARAVRQRTWTDEMQLMQLVAQNVALLRKNPGLWVIRGDNIEWAHQDLLTTYDANVRAMRELAADEQAEPAVRRY